MGIEHGTFGTAVRRSNHHSPIKDFQLVFPKLIHKLHYMMYTLLIFYFFINRYIIKNNIIIKFIIVTLFKNIINK